MNQHDRQILADLAALERLDNQPPKPEPVTCAACAHLRRGPHSPAGLGFCSKFNGFNWLGVQRQCLDFEEKADEQD